MSKNTTEQFLEKAREVHGDTYGYSLVNYAGWCTGIKIVCHKHGEFIQKPSIHLEGKGCPQCGKERTMVSIGKEQEIERMYRDGLSCARIGINLGIGGYAVRDVLKRVEISRRHSGRQAQYQVNHNYFNKIDMSEKAYWLGWMASDGFVVHSKYGHIIGLCLQERDREIIDAFKAAIGSEHPIRIINRKNGKKYLELRVTSRQMVDDLGKLGIIPNKSKTLKIPNISKEFQWDFFCGMFDGDGCVGKRNISLCGTREIVEGFATLCRECGYGSQVYKHNRGTSTWYMRASGFNARGILNKLYQGRLGLSRKKIKAVTWIKKFTEKDELRKAA